MSTTAIVQLANPSPKMEFHPCIGAIFFASARRWEALR